jgi:hypothetical protein
MLGGMTGRADEGFTFATCDAPGNPALAGGT